VQLRTSDCGTGGVGVRMSVLRRVCANFCIWGDRVSQVHLGAKNKEEGLLASAKTLELESAIVWSKINDAITTAFNPEKFKSYIDALNGATQIEIVEPTRAVERTLTAFSLPENLKDKVLAALLGGGDRSMFVLIQSVTVQAHELDQREPLVASAVEDAGGAMAAMKPADMRSLVGAA
jgi:hypothetical protein